MEDLIQIEKEAIGYRIQRLRKLLSLSQEQLAKASGISKGTVNAMESGHGFSGDYILAISHFFGMGLAELVNYKLPLPDEMEFRARIKRYHQMVQSGIPEFLEAPPNLNAVIEYRISRAPFLTKPRSVKEITEFCKNEYNLDFKSSAVSQALINAVNDGILTRVQKDHRNYLYQAQKEIK